MPHPPRKPVRTSPRNVPPKPAPAAAAKRTALPPRHGLARVLSKLGLASRTVAADWIREGRVSVNGRRVRDPELPVVQGRDRIRVDGADTAARERVVVALNKPRGLVTTRSDEQGRDTVYACLADPSLPWLAPVGRLDKASEGLLLFSNDPEWAARISGPGGPSKTYLVQVDGLPGDAELARLLAGMDCDGEHLAARAARVLRSGGKTAWLEVVLDEGRNRQIRRLLEALGFRVQRLLRIAIGAVPLGTLGQGQWRRLDAHEVLALAPDHPGR
jgi:23S rRNA pseudouridine2605 synthase